MPWRRIRISGCETSTMVEGRVRRTTPSYRISRSRSLKYFLSCTRVRAGGRPEGLAEVAVSGEPVRLSNCTMVRFLMQRRAGLLASYTMVTCPGSKSDTNSRWCVILFFLEYLPYAAQKANIIYDRAST